MHPVREQRSVNDICLKKVEEVTFFHVFRNTKITELKLLAHILSEILMIMSTEEELLTNNSHLLMSLDKYSNHSRLCTGHQE